eukprot:gene10384-12279_t
MSPMTAPYAQESAQLQGATSTRSNSVPVQRTTAPQSLSGHLHRLKSANQVSPITGAAMNVAPASPKLIDSPTALCDPHSKVGEMIPLVAEERMKIRLGM